MSGARLLHYFYPWLPRAQVLALFAELDWGMEVQDVQEVLQSARYTELRAGPDNAIREGVWPIYTPNELFARNWVLCLQFDEGILTAKRIRTADSGYAHPIEAFDDEMAHADVPFLVAGSGNPEMAHDSLQNTGGDDVFGRSLEARDRLRFILILAQWARTYDAIRRPQGGRGARGLEAWHYVD